MIIARVNNLSQFYKSIAIHICLLTTFFVVGCQKNPEANDPNNNVSSVDSVSNINTDIHVAKENKREETLYKPSDVSQVVKPQKPALPPQADLPMPPSGFSWKYCEEIKGAFLLPDNWHWKKVNTSNNTSYFITKQSINNGGSFRTGLSIFVIRNIPSKAKMSPSQYATEYIGVATKEKQSLKKWQNEMGPFRGYGCLLRDVSKNAEPTIVHNLLIANDKTGTMYLIIFESPEANWEKEWKIGEVILARLLIDDTI